MANNNDELDLDVEGAKTGGGSKFKLIIITSVAVLLLVGVSVGATLYLAGGMSGAERAQMEEDDKAKEGGEEAKPKGPAEYVALEPPFVVNFQHEGVIRYLQVSVEAMARDQQVIEDVKHHMPAIRNDLVLLFSSQNYETVSTREGKEKLRAEVLADIRRLLEENTGKPGVEAVYFTSFVIQ
jgi:flagellar FliL protein